MFMDALQFNTSKLEKSFLRPGENDVGIESQS